MGLRDVKSLDIRIINAACKVHTAAYLGIIRDMVFAGVQLSEIKHDFLQPDDDEYLTYEGKGFQLVKEWDEDGKVKCTAYPGEWVPSVHGRHWVKRITRFHSAIGAQPHII